jgi:hypothetical protein
MTHTRLTPEREAEIEKEVNSLGMWFCSNWIKDIARDLVAQRDALRGENTVAIATLSNRSKVLAKVRKERDALKAENERLRSRVGKLEEAVLWASPCGQVPSEHNPSYETIGKVMREALAHDDAKEGVK